VRLIDIEGDDRAVSIARLAEKDVDTPADAVGPLASDDNAPPSPASEE
jgi:hypothetical protein